MYAVYQFKKGWLAGAWIGLWQERAELELHSSAYFFGGILEAIY